jgi:hypothetical protein
MEFDDEHAFDKPAAAVMKMFSDRAYFERKCKELGFTEIEVLEHESSGAKFRIKLRYTTKSGEQFPDFARKFLPQVAVVTQQDTWDLQRMTGRLEVEIKGAPVKVACDMALKDRGAGSANELKWTVTSGIPLLGGKLEQVIADVIRSKAANDVATTRRILQDY